jgi:hypothetical protein
VKRLFSKGDNLGDQRYSPRFEHGARQSAGGIGNDNGHVVPPASLYAD